jgi:Ca2+-binding RTX toxin-like protein
MATFTGTNANEIITPALVSPTVVTAGGSVPSDDPDVITAGGGHDTINSAGGDDQVIGGPGNDIALLGAGDDLFTWNPGDGSDTVEGQAGTDTLQFNGANVAEKIDISANGSRVLFTRDVANITMDLLMASRILNLRRPVR